MQDFSSQIKSNCSQKTRKFSQEWHEEEKIIKLFDITKTRAFSMHFFKDLPS